MRRQADKKGNLGLDSREGQGRGGLSEPQMLPVLCVLRNLRLAQLTSSNMRRRGIFYMHDAAHPFNGASFLVPWFAHVYIKISVAG